MCELMTTESGLWRIKASYVFRLNLHDWLLSLSLLTAELDVESLMQSAREAEKATTHGTATPTPVLAWMSTAPVSEDTYNPLTHIMCVCTWCPHTHTHTHTLLQSEVSSLLSQHPHTTSTLNAVQHLLSQRSFKLDANIARWLVALVAELPLIGGVAQGVAVDIVSELTKKMLVGLNSDG